MLKEKGEKRKDEGGRGKGEEGGRIRVCLSLMMAWPVNDRSPHGSVESQLTVDSRQ